MKRPSPAMAVSLIALFFSLGGVGLAARRYIITSTSQIKPSVRKQLRGKTGPRGPQGPQGATGSAGAAGGQGPQGLQGVAGTTPTRAYADVDAAGQWSGAGITSLTHVANTGIYCVTASNGAWDSYASVTLNTDADVGSFAVIDPSGSDCPSESTEVFTGVALVGSSNSEGAPFEGAADDEGFVIVFP
jgi:hypothetical protein